MKKSHLYTLQRIIVLCGLPMGSIAAPIQIDEATFLSGIVGLIIITEDFESFSIGNQPTNQITLSNGTYQSPLPRVIFGSTNSNILIDNLDILAPRTFTNFATGTQFWGADFLVSDAGEYDVTVIGNSGTFTLLAERGNQFNNFIGFSDSLGLLSISVSTVDFSNSGGGGKGIGNYAFDNVITAMVVPLPASIWLFGSGLFGVVCTARRQGLGALGHVRE